MTSLMAAHAADRSTIFLAAAYRGRQFRPAEPHPGRLVAAGVGLEEASQASIVLPITDDLDMREALTAAIAACL